MSNNKSRRKFLNKSFLLTSAGALSLFSDDVRDVILKDANALTYANKKPKYVYTSSNVAPGYTATGAFTNTSQATNDCKKFSTNTYFGKTAQKVCTSACHASCHSSCHSSCHGSCHGSRGWR